MRRYIIGIDGGATKTKGILLDDSGALISYCNQTGSNLTLNPEKVPGRLTLISRMGAEIVTEKLPAILEAVKEAGHPVVWVCDPMHGNTFSTENGHKTRHFDDVLKEITGFFEAHKKVGTYPGGVHLELTGDDVTECLGGGAQLDAEDLSKRYETMCDPRLNGSQSIDIAFRIAELLHGSQL